MRKVNTWIEINLPFGPQWDDECVEQIDSLELRGLNKPGTLIEMETGEVFLIGDINPLRGVCDDCSEFGSDAIVRRYSVLTWDAPPSLERRVTFQRAGAS